MKCEPPLSLSRYLREKEERDMGWTWTDDDFPEQRSSSSSLGLGGIGELGNPNPREEGDRCSTRRIVKSQCKTEEVEPGKFVRKCEKTEQLLRDCVGRPVEVVESNSEYTEHDVTDEMARGSVTFGSESSGLEPFNFPGLRNDIETLERNVFGGLSRFLEAAEEMKSEFFHAFGMPSAQNREPSFNRRKPVDGFFENEATKQMNESAYTEFAGKVRDV